VALAKTGLFRSKPRDAKAAAALQTVLDNAVLAQHKYLEDRKRHQCQITKVPFELLAIIFEMLVYEDQMSPVRISHVSRLWRGTVYGLPNLWSKLVLSGKPARHGIKTKFWMDKSQGRIRHLYIDNSERLEDCLNTMGDKTVAALEKIHFNFVHPTDVQSNYRFKGDPLAFSWTCHANDSTVARRLPFETKSNGFRMTELELESIMLLWPIEVEQLSNLTKLVMVESTLEVGDLFKLLQKSPNIKILQVQTLPLSIPSSNTRIKLPNLDSLKLTADPSILRFIEVPAVQVLELKDIRLSIALQHLTPRNLPLTSFGVIHCSSLADETLPLPDTLTALELIRPAFDVNAILERITAGQCPNITHLNLSGSNANSSSIIRLVKARNGPAVSQSTSPDGSQPDETADFTVGQYPSVRHLNFPGHTRNRPSVIYQELSLTSGDSGRQIEAYNNKDDNSEDKKQDIEELKEGEQAKLHPPRLHTLILDRCGDFTPESLPWLRTRVPIVRCVFESKIHVRRRALKRHSGLLSWP
jgi:hypothetical protein